MKRVAMYIGKLPTVAISRAHVMLPSQLTLGTRITMQTGINQMALLHCIFMIVQTLIRVTSVQDWLFRLPRPDLTSAPFS